MAKYRIYNPYNEIGVHPTSNVSSLPAQTQEDVQARLESAYSARYAGTELEEMVKQGMSSKLADLEDAIDVGAVLDKWAATASFDPERVAVEKAAWLIVRKDGQQAVLMASLEADPASPCGKAWERVSFTWGDTYSSGPGWIADFKGAYWGFDNASELAYDIPWPEGFDIYNTEKVRIDPRFAESELGVWADDPQEMRLARTRTTDPLADEVRAMGYIDWDKRDMPAFPNLFGALAAPGETAPERLFVKAADLDLRIDPVAEENPARQAVRGTLTDLDGNLVASKAVMVGARGVDSAQLEVYQSLYEQTHGRWAGIENPEDAQAPFAKFSQAALVHYGNDHAKDATRPPARDVSGRLPMPMTRHMENTRRTVAADTRAAQESARAQSKSAPRQVMTQSKNL